MTRHGPSKIISLGTGLALALATVVIGAGQAIAEQGTASEAPALASLGARTAMDTGSHDIQDGEEPITFAGLRERLLQLYLDDQISRWAWSTGGIHLKIAERFTTDDRCSVDFIRESFFDHMESFKEIVSDPLHVPSESLRAELLDAADQLMLLCVADGATG